jgi:hypothetical protein
MLLAGFIPLDNTANIRPDWFEFWVILNFLRNNNLENDTWYGFLSPKFYEKTGFDSEYVFELLKNYGAEGNVALFSPNWDQLSYFLNPFEQGEFWHPGLMAKSQEFVDACGLDVNLRSLVVDAHSSVFSNYIIAKREFWEQWKILAEKFFYYAENNPRFQTKTSYGSKENPYPMKTFIQERLATLVLAGGNYEVLCPDQSIAASIFTRLFPDNPETRAMLQACEFLKSKYRETADEQYLSKYWEIREKVPFSKARF